MGFPQLCYLEQYTEFSGSIARRVVGDQGASSTKATGAVPNAVETISQQRQAIDAERHAAHESSGGATAGLRRSMIDEVFSSVHRWAQKSPGTKSVSGLKD